MKSVFVSAEGNVNVIDTVVGVYYRLTNQEEEVDEAYRQLKVALWTQAHVFMENFNL